MSSAHKTKGGLHATQNMNFGHARNSYMFNHSQGMSNMSGGMMQPTPTHFSNKYGSGASQASGPVFAGGQTLHPGSTNNQGWMNQGAFSPTANHGSPNKGGHFSNQKGSVPVDQNHGSGQSTVDMNSPQEMLEGQ